jgi:serine protease inhibitor
MQCASLQGRCRHSDECIGVLRASNNLKMKFDRLPVWIRWAAPVAIGALALVGCARGPRTVYSHEDSRPQNVKQVGPTVLNDFAFRLIGSTVPEGSRQNELISPLSVQWALSLLLNGARNGTADILSQTLGLGSLSVDDLNRLNRDLVEAMQDDEVEFKVANSVWSLNEVQPSQAYQDALRRFYGAEFFRLTGTGDGQVRRVNSWVGEKTKGRIGQIIDRLDPLDRLILINALAFDGKWKHPFDKEQTTPQEFFPEGGEAVEVPMMFKVDQQYPYARLDDGGRAVMLPYRGDKFGMLLVLPAEGEPATQALRQMDTKRLDGILDKLSPSRTKVVLPLIEVSADYALKEALTKMGMGTLFVHADLAGIDPKMSQDFYVSRVIHKTFLKWDEEGTEAAAVTGAIVGITSVPTDPPEFVADRPFTYCLIHRPSKAVVFAGVVHQPAK